MTNNLSSTTSYRIALMSALVVLVAALTIGSLGGDHDAAADNVAHGRIVGTVVLRGEAPKRPALKRDTDPVCARTPKLSEDVVVAANGEIRDVHVRIAVGGAAGSHEVPAEPARMVQHECMYTPRVIGIVQGQDVAIENSDPTYHNVRGARGKRTLWNLGQPPRGPAIVRKDLGKAGEVVSLHCDVHPWMQAFAVITDHPYFAVTGDDGAFAIENAPPGRYEFQAWHPTLGQKSQTIEVKAGATTKVAFTF